MPLSRNEDREWRSLLERLQEPGPQAEVPPTGQPWRRLIRRPKRWELITAGITTALLAPIFLFASWFHAATSHQSFPGLRARDQLFVIGVIVFGMVLAMIPAVPALLGARTRKAELLAGGWLCAMTMVLIALVSAATLLP